MTWCTLPNLALLDSPKKTLDEFELISAIRQTLAKHQLSPSAAAPTLAPDPASAHAPAAAPASALTLEIDSGDDAAAISVAAGCTLVWSVDAFTEGVHFRRGWASPSQVGRRIVAASAADVIAMGAAPSFALVTLACPKELDQKWVIALADGIGAEASYLGMQVVGGDVSRAGEIHVTASVLGVLPPGVAPVTRAGAKPGDVIALHGVLGLAASGLAVNETHLPEGSHQKLREAYAHPKLDKNIGVNAAAAGATSMIDVSDGLIADVGHVALASNVTIDIDASRIRLDPELVTAAALLGLDATKLVLTGGDDHAIVATFPEGASLPRGFEVIGSVREASIPGKVLVDGAPFGQTGGFRHFE